MRWQEDWRGELISQRDEINRIDKDILHLISKRMESCLRIGEIKFHIGKPIFDAGREREVIEDRINIGKHLKLDEDFVKRLIELLMSYSKQLQAAEIHEFDYQ